MKSKILLKGLIMSTILLIFSCTDFIEPNIPYTDFDTATYLRTIDRTSVSFNFFDLASSRFALVIEAVDIEDGNTVESVEVRVRHRRLIPGVGLQFTPGQDVLVSTLTRADFQTNPNSRFLRASLDVPAPAAISAVGLTEAQIEGGDVFEFRLVLRTTTGRVFSDDNRSADVGGGIFYASPFFYAVGVVCPSNPGDWVGTYSTLANGAFGNGSGGDAAPYANLVGEVELTATSEEGVYRISDMSFNLYPDLYGDIIPPGRIRDICGMIADVGDNDRYGDRFVISGQRNASTGVITLTWRNSWGDRGDVVLTPL